MLETRPLFIALRKGFVRWHPCRCHIGDMQAMQVVKYSKFSHTCVRKLEERSGGQRVQEVWKHGFSHMCEHTLRLMKGFNKVIKAFKWD